jgi:PAS domain S-box-containing protein
MLIGSFLIFLITKSTISHLLDEQIREFESVYSKSLAKDIDDKFKFIFEFMEYTSKKQVIISFLKYNHLEKDYFPSIIKDELLFIKKSLHIDRVSMVSLVNLIYYDSNEVVKNVKSKQSFKAISIDKSIITITKEIKDSKGVLIGLLSVDFDTVSIDSILTDSKLIEDIFLVDDDSKIIYSKQLEHRDIDLTLKELLESDSPHIDMDDIYLFSSKIDSIDKHLVVSISKNLIFKLFENVLLYIKLFEFVLFLIFIAILYYVIDNKIVKPIKKIAIATNKFNFGSNIDEVFGDVVEFEEIQKAFSVKSRLLSNTYNELKEMKDLLTNVTDAASDMIFYKNKDLVYIGCNREYAKIWNLHMGDIIGKSNFELFPPDIANRYTNQDKKVLKGESIDDYRWSKNHKGEKRYIYVKKTPIIDSQDNIIGVLGIVRDITAQKSMEDSLKSFNQKLESEVQVKTENLQKSLDELENNKKQLESLLLTKDKFIQNISHELRTPLNSIINFTYHLQLSLNNDLTKEEMRDKLERILKNSKQLLDIINIILNISKIDSKSVQINSKSISLNSILQESYNNSLKLKKSMDIEFKYEEINNDIFVTIDKEKFLIILENIISNALKFTKKGSVTIKAFEDKTYCFIEIIDTGIGIENNDLDKIFNAFEQLNSFNAGVGLGLTIVKKLANAMNIEIELFSKIDVGTTFRLKLKKDSNDKNINS